MVLYKPNGLASGCRKCLTINLFPHCPDDDWEREMCAYKCPMHNPTCSPFCTFHNHVQGLCGYPSHWCDITWRGAGRDDTTDFRTRA